jgi:hypothetical protein
MLLHWVYIVIAVYVVTLIVPELFRERRWREQVSLAVILIPLVLRILHIK